jgi:hypothetical protein
MGYYGEESLGGVEERARTVRTTAYLFGWRNPRLGASGCPSDDYGHAALRF